MKADWRLGFALLLAIATAAAAEPLAWRTVTGGRLAALPAPPPGKVGFTLLSAAQTGLTFTNLLSDQNAAANQIRLNGSGVALGDVNGDGGCDIYLGGLDGDNALFLNRGGWNFERDTNSPVIACRGQDSTGAVLADVDGDGDLDLLVNGIGVGTRLFLNDGKGGFVERAEARFFHRGGASSFALADVDGDGDLGRVRLRVPFADDPFDRPFPAQCRRPADGPARTAQISWRSRPRGACSSTASRTSCT